MKNKKLILIIAALVAVALIAGLGIVSSNKAKAEALAEAQRQAEYEQQKLDAACGVVIPFAQMYGFDDMVCNLCEIPNVGSAWAVFTSEKFGQATDEEKLSFISDVAYYTEQIPHSEQKMVNDIAKHGLDLYVISGEYSYVEWVMDGESQLRQATAEDAYSTSSLSPYKEVIFSMETPHSKDVEASLEAALANDRNYTGSYDSSKGCKRCGDVGVRLTAGGYCKICVDCYYTDYYVGWDGQIYADRPY